MPTALDNVRRSPRKLLRAVALGCSGGSLRTTDARRSAKRAVVARLLARKPYGTLPFSLRRAARLKGAEMTNAV